MTMRTYGGAVTSSPSTGVTSYVPLTVQLTDVGLLAVNVATSTAVTIGFTTSGTGTIATLKAAATVGNQRFALFSLIGARPGDALTLTLGSAQHYAFNATWWPSSGSVQVAGTVFTRASSTAAITAPSVTTTAVSEDVVRVFFDGGGNTNIPTFSGADDSLAGSAYRSGSLPNPLRVDVRGYNKASIGATAVTTATYFNASTSGAGVQVAIAQPPPGIVATADTTNTPARVVLQVAGIPAGSTSVTIVRVDQAGNQSPVRTANPGTLSGGSWVGYDYEAPYGQQVTYIATPDSYAAVTSSAVTLDVQTPWLLHPGVPALSMPVTIESRGDRTRATNTGVHQILGRATPITISDGKRKASTFEIVVRTGSLTEEAALMALLDDTSTLLLQIRYPNITRTTYKWVSIGDVTTTDVVQGFYGSQYLRWTLPCTETVQPSGLLQAQWTWADVLANYPTWNDVKTGYATWSGVILNNPHG